MISVVVILNFSISIDIPPYDPLNFAYQWFNPFLNLII